MRYGYTYNLFRSSFEFGFSVKQDIPLWRDITYNIGDIKHVSNYQNMQS